MIELSMHILDIAENSIRAEATLIIVAILEDTVRDVFEITVADNGKGMDKETLEKVLDPFYTTKNVRKVGLGIPMLERAAKIAGGNFSIVSDKNSGTKIHALFSHKHIDRQPLGDIKMTMATLIMGNPDIDFIYSHHYNGRDYSLDTRNVREELEGIPLNHPEVIRFIKNSIQEGLEKIRKFQQIN